MRPPASPRQRCITLLLIAAVLCRGLVPNGYMAGALDGELRMAFCSEHGASAQWLPDANGPNVVTPSRCDWGFSIGMASLPGTIQSAFIAAAARFALRPGLRLTTWSKPRSSAFARGPPGPV